MLMTVMTGKLWYLQIVRHSHYVNKANEQHHKIINVVPNRGKILDRNGRELAGSVLMQTAYVAPSLIRTEYAGELARDLSAALRLDFKEVHKRLLDNREAPLARKLDEVKANELRDIMRRHARNVPTTALYFINEGKRYYPRSDLASHIIGYTELIDSGDNKGVAGIENSYNGILRGQSKRVRARTNAIQNILEPIDPETLNSTYGHSVVLTIDDAIQHAAEAALRKRVNEMSADAGVAVVYAVKTGEILAMANVPTFSLADVSKASDFQRRNRAVTDAIEPGSVMKIFTFASLLDENKLSLDDSVNCEGGRWSISGRTIVDAGGHGMGTVPAKDVFKNSSNVGTVKLAISRLTPQRFSKRLVNFGFGVKTDVDLPGESPGLLRPFKEWSGLSMSSLPMGYEIQITAVQLAAAAAAIINNGIYMQPHLLKELRDFRGELVKKIEPTALRQVVSPETSRKMLQLMELVVKEGTGKTAACELYNVGGKTGTTKKMEAGTSHYSTKSYIASFCGVAPIEDPQIVVYVYIDNPRGGAYYGGAVSAPVFKEIAVAALEVLKVPATKMDKPAPTLEIVSGRLRDKLAGEVPAQWLDGQFFDDEVSSGCMPDLRGLTMLEAKERLVGLSIPFMYEGSGVVIDQKPAPYETIEASQQALIKFASQQQFFERLAMTIAERNKIQTAVQHNTVSVAQQTALSPSVPVIKLNKAGKSAVLDVAVAATTAPAAARQKTKATKRKPLPLPDLDEYAQRPPAVSAKESAWRRMNIETEPAAKSDKKTGGKSKRQSSPNTPVMNNRSNPNDQSGGDE
ncbi:MAG: penicillin-binding transpeptidase domain-containing protein [bacterium]|nr:penicillin-binding transpeptidase domain-containing protein [Candidatus Sumerlaeota bacterium]